MKSGPACRGLRTGPKLKDTTMVPSGRKASIRITGYETVTEGMIQGICDG